MELSKRLQAVADLVTEGMTVADIGTDHGYVPVYLLNSGKCPKAIAMDINRGPLARAREHISELLVHGEIETRLSDGMKELEPGEVQCAILAGMGGGLVIRILKESRDVVNSLEECVLQPQSEIAKVRAFLFKEGFSVIQENMVEEDGKYYPMMKVIPPQKALHREESAGSKEECKAPEESRTEEVWTEEAWSEEELKFGKLLLKNRHPVLEAYLLREEQIYIKILEKLKSQGGERAMLRITEIERELEAIKRALGRYERNR